MVSIRWLLPALLCAEVFAQKIPTRLTPAERREVDSRIEAFYSASTTGKQPLPGMDARPGKYEATGGNALDPNAALRRQPATQADPLLEFAQAKTALAYQKARCERFLKQGSPWLRCEDPLTWETARPNDQIEDLVASWMTNDEIRHELDEIPVKGQIASEFWSGDYWRMRWGLTSYRYSSPRYFPDYKKAIAAYAQPAEWDEAARTLTPAKLGERALAWSPAEKYDLAVGDTAFTLTNQQKNEGARYLGEDGNVESWFGLCHGWAPAAVFVPTPRRPLTAAGPGGISVTWYPDDVKAIATLAWSNGRFHTNYIGGRCQAKDPKRYDNGRLMDEECFDTNPAALHKALGNQIGRKQAPFIMDSSFDYQVWNQPVLGYELTYFNPLKPEAHSAKWREVAVPYDATFKKQDRFQTPLTRGRHDRDGRWDDSGVRQIVGVRATLVYLAENIARHRPEPVENNLVRVTYTYDLELHEVRGKLVALGGEWHENAHPDFLWVPQSESIPVRTWDSSRRGVDLAHAPSAALTDGARPASRNGYPLCEVVEQVVTAANGNTHYRCPIAD